MTDTQTVVAPFRIAHPDGREYDLEGEHAVSLFESHYHPQGFQIVKAQPFYGVIPEGLARMVPADADEVPDWFLRRQEKADEALPLPMQGEKAGEYDARIKAEREAATQITNQPNIETDGDGRDVTPQGDDLSSAADVPPTDEDAAGES